MTNGRKSPRRLTLRRLEKSLSALIERWASKRFGGWTGTFEEEGVLTDDRGIVLHAAGREFQITIVESTRS